MKTRNLSELYTIVLNYRKTLSLGDGNQFICNAIEMCNTKKLISNEEGEILFEHFQSNRPSSNLHSEFFETSLYLGDRYSAWWNLCGKETAEGVAIRDRFLEKMIKITKR